MKHPWLRAIPIALVLCLLALAALWPSRRVQASAPAEPAAAATVYTNCDVTVQWGGSGATIALTGGSGVTQPLVEGMNVSACSLQVTPASFMGGTMALVSWDPLTLAADPTTLALRSRAFNASDVSSNLTRIVCDPPLVTRTIPRLAEPPRPGVALDFVVGSGTGLLAFPYQPAGPVGVPPASYYVSGAPRAPLSGTHPVLSHGVCGGDSTLQRLRIVQSVMTTNVFIDTTQYELAQRFRVPEETLLSWVELGFGAVSARPPIEPGVLAILDAEGQSEPPAVLPAALASATFGGSWIGTGWGSHFDFDQLAQLEPDHDYWLLARINHDYGVYARIDDDTESPDFIAAIGPLAMRTSPGGAWVTRTDQALCFRVIGEPTGVASVPDPGPAPLGLRLGVAPNPARGAVLVRWAGASGAVRFEVLDARGRRVAAGDAGAGVSGGWTWSATRGDGQRVPAGIYFVRATDAAGHAASERVTVLR